MGRLRPILLVEDNLKDIELVLAALKKNNFANDIVVARDGAEALDYLYRRGQFQSRDDGLPIAMLLDLKMPKVDGLEVLRQIKGDDALKVIPVVMLTSSSEEADLVKSYKLGLRGQAGRLSGVRRCHQADGHVLGGDQRTAPEHAVAQS